MADRFLAGPSPIGFFECKRSKGDLVRYNPKTNELGIVSKDKIIRTFFRPVPCHSIPAALRGIKKCHGFPTDLDYVRSLCAQH